MQKNEIFYLLPYTIFLPTMHSSFEFSVQEKSLSIFTAKKTHLVLKKKPSFAQSW